MKGFRIMGFWLVLYSRDIGGYIGDYMGSIIGVIKGEVYIGDCIGEYHRAIKGHTRSLDTGSNGTVRC